MTTFAFPALGFDPAPGNPDRVDALGEASSRAAGEIATALERLSATRRLPAWDGDAAAAFDVDIGRLPGDLDRACAAYGRAGMALRSYAIELRTAQAHAQRLEQRARGVADRSRVAWLDDPASHFRAQVQATEERAQIEREARRLSDRMDETAECTAALLRTAGETAPYHRPGLLARAVAAVDGWIDDNAESLRMASTALKAVSAVAGLLGFVPVLTPFCAPIAVAAAATALGVDAALAAAGHGSWRTVAVEAVTTLVPGGRVIRAAGTALHHSDRVIDASNHSARGAIRGDVLSDDPNVARRTVSAYRVEGPGNERVLIDGKGDVTIKGRNRCLFLNFGSVDRAQRFRAQRVARGFEGDVIKSFDVDAEFLERLRTIAVAEQDTRRLGYRTFACDATKAPDQFGLRRAEIEKLLEHIVPGSGRVQ